MPARSFPFRSFALRQGSALLIGVLASCLAGAWGCADRSCLCCSEDPVLSQLAERTEQSVTVRPAPCETILPPEVQLEDGLSEDEAIATALTNNAAFQSTLTQLGMADGDAVQAGLPPNPNLITFLPVGPKQWEWTLYLPIDVLFTRHLRATAADDEYDRVAEQVVQNGLNLVRDVRIGFADLSLAVERARLAEEGAQLRQEISELTDKRQRRGEISELEALSARVDSLNAAAAVGLAEQEVAVARNRLVNLMGVPWCEQPLVPPALSAPQPVDFDTETLLDEALTSRPDMRAAHWAVEAAARRARLARWQWLRVDAGGDGNSLGLKGGEAGPGLRFDIPIFHRNPGMVMRADAEWEQALRNRDVIRNQIVQDVRTAAAQLQQARNNLEIIETKVVPALAKAVQISRKGFASGGVAYLMVLQSTSQYLDARSRVLDQKAACRRAFAELERAIGRKLRPLPGQIDAPAPEPIDTPPVKQGGAE